uniref:Uncharacterized protein LOC110210269 n=1 Tax=Phascolarctos cinereus TaxID=38626 RepID=A0A6P5KIC5_PHACI|nr:uncharacterized protein LOC110210269 [Phascolarctos cinereus]
MAGPPRQGRVPGHGQRHACLQTTSRLRPRPGGLKGGQGRALSRHFYDSAVPSPLLTRTGSVSEGCGGRYGAAYRRSARGLWRGTGARRLTPRAGRAGHEGSPGGDERGNRGVEKKRSHSIGERSGVGGGHDVGPRVGRGDNELAPRSLGLLLPTRHWHHEHPLLPLPPWECLPRSQAQNQGLKPAGARPAPTWGGQVVDWRRPRPPPFLRALAGLEARRLSALEREGGRSMSKPALVPGMDLSSRVL